MTRQVKERPILFSGLMIPPILRDDKTQTRRVMKTQPFYVDGGEFRFPWASFYDNGTVHTWDRNGTGGQNWQANEYPNEDKYAAALSRTPYANPCPYGTVGDRLWVRETHYQYGKWVKNGHSATGKQRWRFKAIGMAVRFDAQPKIAKQEIGYHRRPSIHMPRWASRLLLEVTDVRVQRVQEISEDDALAEGMTLDLCDSVLASAAGRLEPQDSYYVINKEGDDETQGHGWDANPYVWAITFKRIESRNE